MTIYADPSFLVSLLYPGDKAHASARAFFLARGGEEWITTRWSRFETVNSLRQQCLQPAGPKPAIIESIRRLFKHWHTTGRFFRREGEEESALAECEQFSAALADSQRIRSADALHVGLLYELQPDLFVTRDKDQFQLAIARGFASQLVA